MSDSIFLFNGNDPYTIVSEKTQADDSQNDTVSINSDAQIAIILEETTMEMSNEYNVDSILIIEGKFESVCDFIEGKNFSLKEHNRSSPPQVVF